MLETLAALVLLSSNAAAPVVTAESVPLPAGAFEAAAVATPIKGPARPKAAIGPDAVIEPRYELTEASARTLVGHAAWYSRKFTIDPIRHADHGEPEVQFSTGANRYYE